MPSRKNKGAVRIIYFVHGSSVDNERGLASGWSDGRLSELGRTQALQLRSSIKGKTFDVIFCSDLRRAGDFARLVFQNTAIVKDGRLREIDYGDLTRAKVAKVNSIFLEHIDEPFPNGESCRDVESRIRIFLDYLLKTCFGKNVAIVGHKAPQLALEVLLKGRTWEQAFREDWRMKKPKKWRAGWSYTVNP